MNLNNLRQAETLFLQSYPGGFSDPAMEPIKKKHNVDKLIKFTRDNLTRKNCERPQFVADALVRIVSQSSMVSRFEKPRFRDFVGSLSGAEKKELAREVFVKPTTAKGIISFLEADTLHYDPTPSWEFYRGFRSLIADIKREVVPSLAPNNAALTGFLMMSLGR